MIIKKQDLAKPVMAQFELTHLCNHKCLHCYCIDSDNISQPVEQIPDETIMSVAKEIAKAEIFNVVITGGEPLLKKDLTKNVIQYLQDHNVQVGLNSNIILLNDEILNFITEHKVNLLTSCPSSINEKFNYMVGANDFDFFCERLKKVYEIGAHCTVNMVVTKDNVHEVKTTARFLKQLGCYSFSATPMFLNMDYPKKELLLSKEEVQGVVTDLLWVEKELEMRIDILESLPKCVFPSEIRNGTHSFLNRKCQAGRTVVGISPNGDVRPCSTNTITYGNILKEDIRDIWGRMEMWRSTAYFPDKCNDCSWIDRCNAGCRINSKAYFGQWNSPEIWCVGPIKEPPVSDFEFYNLTGDTKIKNNNNYCYRKEYDNIFVLYIKDDESFLMVNKELMEFIESLQKLKFSTIKDLAIACDVPANEENFLKTINLLINKKILEYEK